MQLNYRGSTLLIDKEDLHWLSYRKFWLHHSGYFYCKLNNKSKSLHRLIMGEPKGIVDHINRNKLDNRKRNLRIGGHLLNAINRERQSNNTTGYKGVFFLKRINRYIARIGKKPKKYLGCFPCKHLAARAYNKEATKRYGKLAVLNNIQKGPINGAAINA